MYVSQAPEMDPLQAVTLSARWHYFVIERKSAETKSMKWDSEIPFSFISFFF